MKLSFGLLLLFLLTACGLEKRSTGTPGLQTSGARSENGILVDGALETKFSKQAIVQCALKDIEENPLETATTLDIIIPESLTSKIKDDLQSKGKVNKISPETFWYVLDRNLRAELNEILVEDNINQSDAELEVKRKDIAFAFSVYIENPTYDDGYRLTVKDNANNYERTIAFSRNTQALRKVSLCEGYSLKNTSAPGTLLKPSDITARITCSNNKGDTVFIDGIKNKDLYINIKSQKFVDDLHLYQKNFKTMKNTSKRRELIYNNDFNYDYIYVKIKKDGRDSNGIKKLSFEIAPAGRNKVKINNFSCTNIKELNFD